VTYFSNKKNIWNKYRCATWVSVRGKLFEAEHSPEAGAVARAAQLVLYYFMLTKDPALKRRNVAENGFNLFAKFTENPMYTYTLIKPSVKINIISVVGTPPSQTFTARGNSLVLKYQF